MTPRENERRSRAPFVRGAPAAASRRLAPAKSGQTAWAITSGIHPRSCATFSARTGGAMPIRLDPNRQGEVPYLARFLDFS